MISYLIHEISCTNAVFKTFVYQWKFASWEFLDRFGKREMFCSFYYLNFVTFSIQISVLIYQCFENTLDKSMFSFWMLSIFLFSCKCTWNVLVDNIKLSMWPRCVFPLGSLIVNVVCMLGMPLCWKRYYVEKTDLKQ